MSDTTSSGRRTKAKVALDEKAVCVFVGLCGWCKEAREVGVIRRRLVEAATVRRVGWMMQELHKERVCSDWPRGFGQTSEEIHWLFLLVLQRKKESRVRGSAIFVILPILSNRLGPDLIR